ncbi:MAG TPA: hypothetical protein VGG38_16765 [Acidimicrobiales bacterium]|jgi:hypothetical protein
MTVSAAFPLKICFNGNNLTIKNTMDLMIEVDAQGSGGTWDRQADTSNDVSLAAAKIDPAANRLPPNYQVTAPIGDGPAVFTVDIAPDENTLFWMDLVSSVLPGAAYGDYNAFSAFGDSMDSISSSYVGCIRGANFLEKAACTAEATAHVGLTFGTLSASLVLANATNKHLVSAGDKKFAGLIAEAISLVETDVSLFAGNQEYSDFLYAPTVIKFSAVASDAIGPAIALPASAWTATGGASTPVQNSDGSFSTTFSQVYWGGLYAPSPVGCNYAFTGEAQIGGKGEYGFGARTSIAADGTPTTQILQYDQRSDRYEEDLMPGDGNSNGSFVSGDLDSSWHTISIQVNGSHYESIVDGQVVFQGTTLLPCGGLYIRLWQGTVNLKDLSVQSIGPPDPTAAVPTARELGPLNLSMYCESLNEGSASNSRPLSGTEGVFGNALNNWECSDGTGYINMNAVCQQDYPNDSAYAYLPNQYDATSWDCYSEE